MQSSGVLAENSSPVSPTPINDNGSADDTNSEVFAIPMEIETTITLESCEHLPSNNLVCEPAQIISVTETINESHHQPILSEREEQNIQEQVNIDENLCIKNQEVLSEHEPSVDNILKEVAISEFENSKLQHLENSVDEIRTEENNLVSIPEDLQNIASQLSSLEQENQCSVSETIPSTAENHQDKLQQVELLQREIENDTIGE